MQIRPEQTHDIDTIRQLTTAAFLSARHTSHTEAAIVDALRLAGALTLSLVAIEADQLIGHAAFSPVLIDGANLAWYGLAPVSVRPDWQNQGIGQALIRAGLDTLRLAGAQGCVVLGEPSYYTRFDFTPKPNLRLADVPPDYFLALPFTASIPSGTVTYHPALQAT